MISNVVFVPMCKQKINLLKIDYYGAQKKSV